MKLGNNLSLPEKIIEGDVYEIGDAEFEVNDGVLKNTSIIASKNQSQTQDVFGFKWEKEDTFDSKNSLERMKKWLLERYKDPGVWLNSIQDGRPLILDAGCGAGMSGFECWGEYFSRIKYVGMDISPAVYVAKDRGRAKGCKDGVFIQDSIENVKFTEPMFDIIFSEGVLHHTDNTEKTFNHLCRFLKPDGLFMFYVYRKKAPMREFTDDYIRNKIQEISPEEAWNSLKPLTKLGIELGKMDLEIDVPEDIDLLGITAGKKNLQRLFYWNIFKAFYDPNLTFDEMHHINFDWYAPKNAHRHTIDEVRSWCSNNGLEIQHEVEELAGITCIAKKK